MHVFLEQLTCPLLGVRVGNKDSVLQISDIRDLHSDHGGADTEAIIVTSLVAASLSPSGDFQVI